MAEFSQDVIAGFGAESKRLSSKYFYDDEGSRIFQEIMAMPEYYLTDCEMEILTQRSVEILERSGLEGTFNVIEMGAGDGVKTQVMLKAFLEAGAAPVYHPIDISKEAVEIVSSRIGRELPDLKIKPEVGDYFKVLHEITSDDMPCLILFLGSNIGNYIPPKNKELVEHIFENMSPGDQLVIGVDLRKDPNMIRRAYDDPHGITKRFNLNLLERMNRELGAGFQLDQWDFYCHYNPMNGEVRSYLVSLCDQSVTFDTMEVPFHFKRNELIWTELSKKYTLEELEDLANDVGLEVKGHFMDSLDHFTDSLFIRT